MNKLELRTTFITMCRDDIRDTSLSMYKVFRHNIKGMPLTGDSVKSWLRMAGLEVIMVAHIPFDTYTHSVHVQLPEPYIQTPFGLVVDGSSYSECLYKLAFKLIAHRWDMTLSQIHELENWSYPVHNRLTSNKD